MNMDCLKQGYLKQGGQNRVSFYFMMLLMVLLSAMALPVKAGDVALEISTKGQFVAPQTYQVDLTTRVASVVNAWRLKPEAYRLGIAMLREDEKREQSRMRWALEYQLKTMPIDPELKASLTEQVGRLVATGRVLKQFNWDLVEVKPKQNRLLKEGDTFIAPYRPTTVQISGAVKSHTMPFVGGKTVRQYVHQVIRLAGADPSVVWVIAPDANIRQIGVSYWNAQKAYLAPGSVIYVPLQGLQAFNRAMVTLYAAQVLPY